MFQICYKTNECAEVKSIATPTKALILRELNAIETEGVDIWRIKDRSGWLASSNDQVWRQIDTAPTDARVVWF